MNVSLTVHKNSELCVIFQKKQKYLAELYYLCFLNMRNNKNL